MNILVCDIPGKIVHSEYIPVWIIARIFERSVTNNRYMVQIYRWCRFCCFIQTKKASSPSKATCDHRTVIISISVAFGQTPAYAAKTTDTGLVYRMVYLFIPAFTCGYLPIRRASPPLGRYQVILPGDRGTWVWTTCLRLLPDSAAAGNPSHDRLVADCLHGLLPGPFLSELLGFCF